MIQISHLSHRFDGVRVLDDICLTLPRGSLTAIVGTSGSGKSTLLRCVNRLLVPEAGEIRVKGSPSHEIPVIELRRNMGYVIQDHGLFPHWTVERNIGTVPELLGWERGRIAQRVRAVMALLGLDPATLGPRFPAELSGGQAQRVGVARALAAEPEILLMDEPFGALDPITRQNAQRQLAALHKSLGTTILLVTHDMSEALSLADQIAVMDGGRIVQCGAPEEIVLHPATPFVAALIAQGERAFRALALQPIGPWLSAGVAQGPEFPAEGSLAEALAEMIWSGRSQLPIAGPSENGSQVLALSAVLAAGRAR